MGQTYHSFNDIPALWEEIFVAHRPYKALAAGIAGAHAAATQLQMDVIYSHYYMAP
jgi:hypothetical protein